MPTKYRRVLLTRNLEMLGAKNSMVLVKAGYARNYLIPNKLAVIVTPGLKKQADRYTKIEKEKQLHLQKLSETLQQKFEKISKITLKKKVGKSNVIFGTVTDREIATVLSEVLVADIQRKQVIIPEVKNTGVYSIQIQLQRGLLVSLGLHILPTYI